LQCRLEERRPLLRRRKPRVYQAHAHREHVVRIEAGVDVPEGEQALDHHAGAHQQHQRQRDLAHDQQAARADTDRTVAASTFLERVVEVGLACAHGRQRTGEHAREHRHPHREQQHSPIDRDFLRPRHLTGEQRRRGREGAVREQKPERATSTREEQCFGQQLLKHASACRAKRQANRDLLASAQGASEEQVADVGAGDEEHQPDGAEQHEKHRAAIADDFFLHRDDHGSPPVV
jgi:hypothetical protein